MNASKFEELTAHLWDDNEIQDEFVSEDPNEVNEYIMNQQSFDIKGGKSCKQVHDGSGPVFGYNYKTVGGAEGAEVNARCADLILDLAGLYSQSALKSEDFVEPGVGVEHDMACDWQKLNEHITSPPVIRFHWRDMGVPPVGVEFWREVWKLLPDGHTIICCHGGHGRTGTALAALMVTHPEKPCSAESAINRAREYCPCAIETMEQENYIHDLASYC